MTMYKIFYFKNKLFDFHIKIFFLEIKLYLGSFIGFIFSLLKPYNYISLFKIYKSNNQNNILITELNKVHSEIFPAWLFYLKQLPYKGDIFFLAPDSIHKLSPFDLLSKEENNGYFFYKMDAKIILLCFKLGLFRKYKKVIFNSDIFYSSNIDSNYTHILDVVKKDNILKNTIFLAHLILQTMGSKNNLINAQNKLITISPSIAKDTNIKYVVPIFHSNSFQEDKGKEKFDQKKQFISCGNIKIAEKDSKSLKTALKETKKYDKNINIIGKAPKSLIMRDDDVIHYKKKISFLKLKSILEKSHFILFLLNNELSYRYKFNTPSGSLPLALNFNLIPIIEESFAEFYCLDKKNAIIYKEGYLSEAIKYACDMKYDEYLELQFALNNLKSLLLYNSSNNLKQILS